MEATVFIGDRPAKELAHHFDDDQPFGWADAGEPFKESGREGFIHVEFDLLYSEDTFDFICIEDED